jgi:hypothetical protein
MPERELLARHWWLTPVIVVTQEAEVQSQPGQIVHKHPISKIPNTKKGWQMAQVPA